MKNSLTLKLFLVLVTIISLIVVMMFLLMRFSFQRNFINYINQADQTQLLRIQKNLASFYSQEGSWSRLYEQPYRWREMTAPESALGYNRDFNNLTSQRPDGRLGRPGPRSAPGPGPGPDPLYIGPRLTLFDLEYRPIIGRARSAKGINLHAIIVDGETVGWLGVIPLQTPSSKRDIEFFRQQAGNLYIIAAIMFVIAAILSLLMAPRLLKPIRALAAGARQLAGGDFETRVSIDSRDELGQLASDFNNLSATLSVNQSARQRWIADISHELRTPLAILRGELEALQDGVRQYDEKTLVSLHSEVSRLNKIVDDLYQLSLSDLGALDYQKESIDVSKLLKTVIDSYQSRFESAGLNLQFDDNVKPFKVMADGERMTQMFYNILENSLRYTDTGGSLNVKYTVSNKSAIIDFQDSAPGVSNAALVHLFDPLYREEASRNRARGGAGLGLAISRKIIEAHYGTVEAKHSPYDGLWIRIRFPLNSQDNA